MPEYSKECVACCPKTISWKILIFYSETFLIKVDINDTGTELSRSFDILKKHSLRILKNLAAQLFHGTFLNIFVIVLINELIFQQYSNLKFNLRKIAIILQYCIKYLTDFNNI